MVQLKTADYQKIAKGLFPVWNILISRETTEMPFIFTTYK